MDYLPLKKLIVRLFFMHILLKFGSKKNLFNLAYTSLHYEKRIEFFKDAASFLILQTNKINTLSPFEVAKTLQNLAKCQNPCSLKCGILNK